MVESAIDTRRMRCGKSMTCEVPFIIEIPSAGRKWVPPEYETSSVAYGWPEETIAGSLVNLLCSRSELDAVWLGITELPLGPAGTGAGSPILAGSLGSVAVREIPGTWEACVPAGTPAFSPVASPIGFDPGPVPLSIGFIESGGVVESSDVIGAGAAAEAIGGREAGIDPATGAALEAEAEELSSLIGAGATVGFSGASASRMAL